MVVNETIYSLFASISGAVLVFGVLVNGVVCSTFLVYRSLLSKENILIFSMALSDFLCCAIAVPTSLISNIKKKWVFGDVGCQIHALVVTWCGLISITHFTALSFIRYRILNALPDKIQMHRGFVYWAVALWGYSFIFAIAPVLGWSRYVKEGIGTSCSVDWKASVSDVNAVSYTASLFVGCFVVPLAIIIFSLCKIYRIVKEITEKAKHTWGRQSVFAKQTAKVETKMAILLFAMVVAFLVAWLPYSTVSLICVFGGCHWVSPLLASAPAYLAKSSTLYNPILYFFMYRRFRVRVLRLARSGRAVFRRSNIRSTERTTGQFKMSKIEIEINTTQS